MHCGAAALLLLAFSTQCFAAPASKDVLAELRQLRDQSSDGVIHVTDDELKRFAAGKQRGWSLVVFLSANQVADNPQLAMGKLRQEFALVAKAFQQGPAPDAAFFVDMVFEESPRIFRAVQAQKVPYIFVIGPNRKLSLTDMPIPNTEKLLFETVQGAKYPWSAEVMVEYLQRNTGLEFGEVYRFSLLKSPYLVPGALLAVLLLALLVYKLWWTWVVQSPVIWAIACIAVVWFSMSGGMFNIIRGMPMFGTNQQGQLQLFMNSRQAQYGAEGFIIGAGYVAFSLAVSLLTYGVPRVKSFYLRQVLSCALVAAAGFIVMKLSVAYHMKTGYRISSYLL